VNRLFAAFVAFAVAFVWVESKAPEPILPLRLFRGRTFAVANINHVHPGLRDVSASIIFVPL